MKKILILTSGQGIGDDFVARRLQAVLEKRDPDGSRVQVLDLFGDHFKSREAQSENSFRMDRWFWSNTDAPRREALQRHLDQSEPDIVISTDREYEALVGELYQKGRRPDFTLIAFMVDALSEEAPPLQTGVDFFAVMDDRSRDILHQKCIDHTKIKRFGRSHLLDSLLDIRSPLTKKPKILCILEERPKKCLKLIARLLEADDLEVTVLTRSTKIEKLIGGMMVGESDRLQLGHSEDVAKLLTSHSLVICPPRAGLVQAAVSSRCPMIAYPFEASEEKGPFALLHEANAGVRAETPREAAGWVARALAEGGRLLTLWRRNIEIVAQAEAGPDFLEFVLSEATSALASRPVSKSIAKKEGFLRGIQPRKRLLMCDLHTHTTWSDGKLSIAELVDFYGVRGFDCLCITDHLCDPKRLLGKLVNLTGLVILPDQVAGYFAAIEREKKRAWDRYELLLMTGLEFNKDGYTAKTSTHLLGIDLKAPIDPALSLKELIAEIQRQGGLAVASHPHETKSTWGKDTLHLWEHVDEYAPLLDAWEIANRDDIFNPIGLKKLPFIASSDFHKPKHIDSWKTVLHCEKEAEAIKECIRVNRDVSLMLYRGQRFGVEEQAPPLEIIEFDPALQPARREA